MHSMPVVLGQYSHPAVVLKCVAGADHAIDVVAGVVHIGAYRVFFEATRGVSIKPLLLAILVVGGNSDSLWLW